MKFAVEAWAPEYGASVDGGDGFTPSAGDVDLDIEVPQSNWAPIGAVGLAPCRDVLFVDGVRRVDARVWITTGEGQTVQGLCVSYGAGAVRCNGHAEVVDHTVERGLFSTADASEISFPGGAYRLKVCASDRSEVLTNGVQQRMRALEVRLARAVSDVELVVVDGPLWDPPDGIAAIGYIKTHEVSYLPPELDHVVADLGPSQRTPVFLTSGGRSRYSWYLRLPHGQGHPWAGVVRCEAAGDLARNDALHLADLSVATLPRFASEPHKDTRAPQNLYPIAGLERRVRHLLGSTDLLVRRLRTAAVRPG